MNYILAPSNYQLLMIRVIGVSSSLSGCLAVINEIRVWWWIFVDAHVILATVNFYLLVIVFTFDSSISPELIYLTKIEGNNNSLVSKLQLNIQLNLITRNSTNLRFCCFLFLFLLWVRVTWLLCLSVVVELLLIL